MANYIRILQFLSQNRSGLHTKILTQLVEKLSAPHVIRSSSPVTNSSGGLTNKT